MKKILIILGLHPRESCAPIIGEVTARQLTDVGLKTDVFRIRSEFSLSGNLDAIQNADSRHCANIETGELDIDLESLVGDAVIAEEYPEHIAFEFHNYSDANPSRKLAVAAGTPPSEFRIGDISPGKTGPYEIGYWQNRPGGGVPGKFLVELPAVFQPVSAERTAHRLDTLDSFVRQGVDLPRDRKDWILREFALEADVERSREKGYLDEDVAFLVSRWIQGEANPGGS